MCVCVYVCVCYEENSDVHNITVSTTHNEEGRKYDKKCYCFFCKKSQSKIACHLKTLHNTEREVEEYLSENDPKVKELMLKLRNHGNHQHNCQVF